jgi:hypothetical protein
VKFVEMAVGRGKGEGEDGYMPVRKGRYAWLLARIGVGRRLDGLCIIILALILAASQQ